MSQRDMLQCRETMAQVLGLRELVSFPALPTNVEGTMSLELYAFLEELPDRNRWQAGITRRGIDLQLDPDLDLTKDKGFSPCTVHGRSSGFELYVMSTPDVLGDYPSATSAAGTRPHAVCFRWGGDLAEAACVLGAALALATGFQAIVYDPAEDVVYDEVRLAEELKACEAEL